MAFVTQCPHCQTFFRAAHDQLKIHNGLVRCGTCHEVFNGSEHLISPSQPKPAQTESEVTNNTSSSSTHVTSETTNTFLKPTTSATKLATQTLEPSASISTPTHESPPPKKILLPNEILPKNKLAQSTISYKEEPNLIVQTYWQINQRHVVHLLINIAFFIMVFLALGQSLYVFRNDISARLPAFRPMLEDVCSILNCRIESPHKIDQLSIESSELQTLAGQKNIVALNTLLRNQSSTEQAWPYLEVTLTNENERVIARRAFAPNEYLSASEQKERGFPPQSEHFIKLLFNLSQLPASGYRVYLFYP